MIGAPKAEEWKVEGFADLPSSLRLQQMHSDLLLHSGIDQQTYRELSTSPQTGRAHGPGGGARGTTKHYKESNTLEEIWKETKNALSRQMTESNFRTHIADTYALAFDGNLGILVVQIPNPLNSLSLHRQFHRPIVRTIRNLQPAFDDVPVQHIEFQSRR